MVAKKKVAKSAEAEKHATIFAVKGFDANLSCRGLKFEVGKTYTVAGKIKACSNGFHACENPLDVWSYYPIVNDEGKLNRFAVVEMSGEISRHDEDSKIASASITIKAEISLPEFIGKAVSWIVDYTKQKVAEGATKDGAELLNDNGGDSARIGSSGDSAQIGSSGDYARIVSEGANAVIASAGPGTTASGKDGSWISLAEFKDGKCIGFATGCIGQGGLKPDTAYRALGGKLIPA